MKTVRRITTITAVVCCLALVRAGTAPAQETNQTAITSARPQEPVAPTARVDLFNGKDFTGWAFFMRSNAAPAETWRVEDGIIKCTGKPNGYMRTVQGYRDYRVTVEWRFTKPGNTGVLVHLNQPDNVWPRCVECQGMHNQQGDFWLWGGADFKEPKNLKSNGIARHEKEAEQAVGEWNTYQVECVGNNVKIFVNGKLVNEGTECNLSSGAIGIQSEGAEIEVRKIFLEPAKAL